MSVLFMAPVHSALGSRTSARVMIFALLCVRQLTYAHGRTRDGPGLRTINA